VREARSSCCRAMGLSQASNHNHRIAQRMYLNMTLAAPNHAIGCANILVRRQHCATIESDGAASSDRATRAQIKLTIAL